MTRRRICMVGVWMRLWSRLDWRTTVRSAAYFVVKPWTVEPWWWTWIWSWPGTMRMTLPRPSSWTVCFFSVVSLLPFELRRNKKFLSQYYEEISRDCHGAPRSSPARKGHCPVRSRWNTPTRRKLSCTRTLKNWITSPRSAFTRRTPTGSSNETLLSPFSITSIVRITRCHFQRVRSNFPQRLGSHPTPMYHWHSAFRGEFRRKVQCQNGTARQDSVHALSKSLYSNERRKLSNQSIDQSSESSVLWNCLRRISPSTRFG